MKKKKTKNADKAKNEPKIDVRSGASDNSVRSGIRKAGKAAKAENKNNIDVGSGIGKAGKAKEAENIKTHISNSVGSGTLEVKAHNAIKNQILASGTALGSPKMKMWALKRQRRPTKLI